MTSPRQRRATQGLATFLAGAILLTAACSSGGSDSTQGQNDSQASGESVNLDAQAGEAICFTVPTDEQREEFDEFVDGLSASDADAADDDVEDVCVLEEQADGNYVEQHYADDDGFDDFFLYALLFRNSRTLATYGLLSGDLDPGQFLALSLLAGPGADGRVYRPYSYTNYGWARQPVAIANAKVTKFRYGTGALTAYTPPSTRTVPAGYSRSTPIPRAEDRVASITRRPGQVATVTTSPGISARSVIASSTPVDRPTTRRSAPPPSAIPNPSTGSSGGSSSSDSGSRTRTTVRPGSGGSSSGGSSSGGSRSGGSSSGSSRSGGTRRR